VLVILNRKREVVFVDRFHRLDWSLQLARVKAATDRFNRARILVDSTGAGEPLFEEMKRAGFHVAPYAFTKSSKSALVDNLALMLEKKEIALPTAELWPDGIDELESFEFTVNEAGNIRTGAPSGAHDDCVMALALAAWQAKRAPGKPQIFLVSDISLLHRMRLGG